MANEFKFQPSEVATAVNKKLVIERLPEWMQSLEQIQMFFDDIIQQWFNPADQEIVNGYIGDRGSPSAASKIFLSEKDLQRQEYQLSPAYVSRNTDLSVRSLQFYSDLVGYLNQNGALTDNNDRLLSGAYYSWTPPINPNKLQNFSSYVWDNNNEYGIKPDYIVMQRGALNGNTWSLQNFWYTIGQTLSDGTVLTEQLAQSTRFSRAQVPIIEFNKNIELTNYGTDFRGVVDYLSDTIKPEDIVQKNVSNNVRIDGNVLQSGDRILFTSIGNAGENNRIYKVYIKTMDDGNRVYGLVLDEDEMSSTRPTAEPINGDVILIKSGSTYGNTTVYWNGSDWVAAQAKTGINVFPSFVLYDKNGVALNDSTTYPGSTFTGSNIFGLKIDYNYNLDAVYNKHVELSSSYNYYVFENFIQTERFNYTKAGVSTEIPGIYFYKVIDSTGYSLKSDWVRSDSYSKQRVRQVPSITKSSMYRVFNTLYELTSFDSPIENMYAYVVETDTTYQYYKPSNASYLKWNVISTDAVQSDIYVKDFELAQKIDPTNTNETLEVYIDGTKVTDYTKNISDSVVDTITLGSTITLTDDSIVEIYTYSPTKTPDLTLGSYEIPINLQYNPYNSVIDYTHQGLFTLHFDEIISKNITTGSVNDLNDYELQLEAGNVDNSVGTKIIQNEVSLLPLMICSANENLDIFSAITFAQYEYFRFKNKFNTAMIDLYTSDPTSFLNETASNLVDTLLNTVNLGKDSTFPFSIDNVGATTSYTKTYIPPTPQFLGMLKAYAPEKATYLHLGSAIGCYNIDHMGIVSKAYHSINGVDLMDSVLYELETRIFNSIDSTFRSVDFVPAMDKSLLCPTPYYTSTEYSMSEYNKLELRGYVNFIAINGIDNSTHSYDQNNWMTWNYTGTNYVVNGVESDIPARGSWRAIYTDMFGTYRPHTHPWEMFGFSQQPSWFNQEYKPTKVRLGQDSTEYVYVYEAYVTDEAGNIVPSGLWDTTSAKGDASTGTILYGNRAGHYDRYKRFGTQPFEIVKTGVFTSDNEEICELNLLSPDSLGMVSGSLSHLSEPWSYGDMGEMEFTYMNTVMYAFDNVLALLRAKPAQFANYFYDTKGSTLQTVKNGKDQFLYGNTNLRLNLSSSTVVHTENSQRILGYQTWISENLIHENMSVTTNYGDILRSSYINVGHRIGGYTKQDQLTFTSDSFGNVSQENQHIGLVKSSAIKNEVLSAVKIQKTANGYAISGYDLVGAEFTYKVPNKIGKRTTVTVGNKSVVYYNDYTSTYSTYEYGTLLKTIQDVYTFLCAYGQSLEDDGWIFEDADENGVVQDWKVIAEDFISWAITNPANGDYISVSPSTKNAKFGSTFGSVLSITQFNGGVWSLLDDTNVGIRPYEVQTSRIGNVFTVRLDDDSDKRMALLRVSVVSYEHAIVFDDSTVFNYNIYIPAYGSIHEMLKMYGYITGSWNGRLEADGFVILETGTLPNFEKLVQDFYYYYDNENPIDDTTLKGLARHLIGFQTRDYLTTMFTSDSAQVDFYKGFISDKGTNQVFEKVLRVSKSYDTTNYKALQEWAFKIGEYGNVDGKKHLQFQMINNEFSQQPQLMIFDETATSDTSSNDITFYGSTGEDSRWIYRPSSKYSFPMRTGRSENINLPNIGPVTLDEVDYTTVDFTTAYTDRSTFVTNNDKQPSSVWMFSDSNNEWNIFDIVNTGVTLESISVINDADTANYALTFCTLQLSAAHGLEDGQYYFFLDSTNYMPDLLAAERVFYTTGTDSTVLTVAVNLSIDINFTDTQPVLYKYVSKFASEADRDTYVQNKYLYNAPESSLFDRPSTYNSTDNTTETYLNVYDPINGVIPGSLMAEMTYISPVDPAMYNNDDTTKQSWGSEKVGLVWWDTSTAYFMDYTRAVYDSDGNVDLAATREHKRTNWGKLLPGYDIAIYEWVSSPVTPYDWATYCTAQQKLNKSESTWVPSGDAKLDYYSETSEYDESTDTYKTVYYFWVKNPIYVPENTHRKKTCNEISRCIIDPTQLNIPWFAPIDENAFIVSDLQYDINDDKSILSLSYQYDNNDIVKHEQYQLCKEGQDYNFNPYIWDKLWNSLLSQETLPDGTVKELHYPTNDTGNLPQQTWFENVIEARRTFVASANSIYKIQNITTDTVIMSDVFNVKITEANPNSVQFKVLTVNNELVISTSTNKFVENDAVLVSSTGTLPAPLTSSDVYFVHYDDNGYVRLMNSPSTRGVATDITLQDIGEGTLSMIKQSDYIETLSVSLDMTKYWSLADWYAEGYDENTVFTDETSIDTANNKNYQEGDIIRVYDSSNYWTLYEKTLSRDVVIWQAIARESSTIALNDLLYTDYTQYNSDGSLTATETNVRKALALLKSTFDLYQSRLVFDMVKYVHTEQSIVDWVFKTSYIYVIGLEQSLTQTSENDDLIDQIIEYFEEVKPYRTKIRSQIEQLSSNTDEMNGISNDLDPNGYVYANSKWTKVQDDIWDVEYAEYNSTTAKWEVQGSLPSTFVLPDRMFQESYELLQFDNVQCTPDSSLPDAATLEKLNSSYQSNTSDTLDSTDEYKLQRYKFTYPEFDSSTFEDAFKVQLLTAYSDIDLDSTVENIINNKFKELANDQDATSTFLSTVNSIYSSLVLSDTSVQTIREYTQYNTLANRRRLYTSLSDSSIDEEMGCPFKGRVLSDNIRTRLPFGFSGSSFANYGYILYSKDLYNKFVSTVKTANPTYTQDEINNYLVYEYGLYSWTVDQSTSGKNYLDTLYVLTAMRNTYNPDATDQFEIARQILNLPTFDMNCMVMIPRKYIRIKNVNTDEYLEVPMDQSLDEFMQNSFITNNDVVEIEEPSLNDLVIDQNNPLYSTILDVIENINALTYADDMNAFDNFGLESQVREMAYTASGVVNTTQDPTFVDISEINALGLDAAQLRFTVSGYGYDTSGNLQLRDQGNFQIEGFIVQNPYNLTEALVTIPRYNDAIEYMNKDLISKNEIRYIYNVSSVLSTNGKISLNNTNDFNVGEKVAVFTTGASDVEVQLTDGTWQTILSVNSIKQNNRPVIFTVSEVLDNTITIDGLVFENTYHDHLISNPYLGMSVVRVTSFNDPEFVQNEINLYSTYRNYKISILNYDLIYDRMVIDSTYTDNLSTDDYDSWFISNEVFELPSGIEADHGYYLPIYGEGVLSELVHPYIPDDLQIFIYEYEDAEPVYSNSQWTYNDTLIDEMYLSTKDAKLTVVIVDTVMNEQYAVTPESFNTGTITGAGTNSVLTGTNVIEDNVISLGNELLLVRKNGNVLKGQYGSIDTYYVNGTSYNENYIVLGKESTFDIYSNNYFPIPLSKFSSGLELTATQVSELL